MSADCDVISRKQIEAGLTQDDLAFYADVSAGSLSNGLRGRGFSREIFLRLDRTLNKFLRIRKILGDVPLNFKDVRRTQILLERLENDQPLISATATLPPSQTAPITQSTGQPSSPQPPAPEPEIDVELVACVMSGDYLSLCERRGWDQDRLMKEIAKNAKRMRFESTNLAVSNADRARLHRSL